MSRRGAAGGARGGLLLWRSALTRRLRCDARAGVAPRNSLRSLRSLRSNNRGESDERSALRAPTPALRFSPPHKSPTAEAPPTALHARRRRAEHGLPHHVPQRDARGAQGLTWLLCCPLAASPVPQRQAGPWRRALRRLLRRRPAMVGLAVVLAASWCWRCSRRGSRRTIRSPPVGARSARRRAWRTGSAPTRSAATCCRA